MSKPIIDHFTYGTYEVRKNPKETISRVGYRYGHLALLRTSFTCPSCDDLHVMWSVASLVSGGYPFPGAAFTNIDDGCAYIYEITPWASWDTITDKEMFKLAERLLYTCLKHKGLPTVLVKLLDPELRKDLSCIAPGSIAGLNGYTKQ